MPNPGVGIAQGFIVFGTVAHRILVLLLEHGTMTHADLLEADVAASREVLSNILSKLVAAGFCFRRDKLPAHLNGGRTGWAYSLRRRTHLQAFRPTTGTERRDRSRKMACQRASSVFDWRP